MRNRLIATFGITIIMALFPNMATAQRNADRVQIGRDIVVQASEKVGDVVCVACSIRMRGQGAGDVVAVAGSVTLEQGAQVAGDVTTVAGSVKLENGTQVAGGVTSVMGKIRRDPQSVIAGDVTDLSGGLWMVLFLLLPILFVGGIVALIVWFIQKLRTPTPAPAYPGGNVGNRS